LHEMDSLKKLPAAIISFAGSALLRSTLRIGINYFLLIIN